MYYRHGIWHIDFITKLRPGDNCHDKTQRLQLNKEFDTSAAQPVVVIVVVVVYIVVVVALLVVTDHIIQLCSINLNLGLLNAVDFVAHVVVFVVVNVVVVALLVITGHIILSCGQ